MTLDDDTIARLIAAASAARERAYAPYSRYRVGAALLCADDSIVTGCNVENSSYSVTCCAERSALFTAVSAGHRSFRAIAVSVHGEAVAPCGVCRQALAEFGTTLPIVLHGEGSAPVLLTLEHLLPLPFTPDALS